ncbi:unnamed protein product [Rotaria magnacalcarata]|nr:unnamed protein product [Rotaria magnacalcarata]CAF1664252.1 unnamed protein product [Rotaria magnacalcarata]CAF1936981.1 unnamed protein product [Rotaria magnacalcarata]
MMIVVILIALTQIILAHPVDHHTLSTTSTLSFDSMNDTTTIGFVYNNARDVFSKPSLSRQLSVPVALVMVGGSVIGLGSGLVLLWILYKRNIVPKSVVST